MIRSLLASLAAVAAAAAPAHALTVVASSTASGIGVDGTDRDDDRVARHVLDITVTAALTRIDVDWSAFGAGAGTGVDLGNVSTTPGADVRVIDTSNGLNLGLDIGSITIDNEAKTLRIVLASVVSVGAELRVEIGDVQNPPCPGTRAIAVRTDGLTTNSGSSTLTFDGGRTDADGDRLPDGFEIYYGAGSIRGDADANPAYKNVGLDPDVADPLDGDRDGDRWSDVHEWLACTHPGDDGSAPAADDTDGDGAIDIDESYPGEVVDTDRDGTPDVADDDSDGDGILDRDEVGDADPATPPVDTDGDGRPDLRDVDSDGDGILDGVDNCRLTANRNQADRDGDGVGDACDDDADGDGVGNDTDNCPYLANPDQADTDGDGVGDACEGDRDSDGVNDDDDNCPSQPNPDQADTDGDGIGDACDSLTDSDDDGIGDSTDNCPYLANPDQADTDGDGIGDACEGDRDSDGVGDDDDSCPSLPSSDQADTDGDGIGDACDGLTDGIDRLFSFRGGGCQAAPDAGLLVALLALALLVAPRARRR